jgi:hypothetical protein
VSLRINARGYECLSNRRPHSMNCNSGRCLGRYPSARIPRYSQMCTCVEAELGLWPASSDFSAACGTRYAKGIGPDMSVAHSPAIRSRRQRSQGYPRRAVAYTGVPKAGIHLNPQLEQ